MNSAIKMRSNLYFLSIIVLMSSATSNIIGKMKDNKQHPFNLTPLERRLPGPAPRIVGGTQAQVGRYPYIVSLLNVDQPFCGGTLIDPEWVLSAAHCAGYSTHVLIGHHDFNDIPQSAEKIAISYEKIHPFYNDNTLDNDIMMVRLSKPSSFPVVKMDLTTDEEIREGTDVTVMGWGTTYSGGSASDVLLEVTVQMLTNQKCAAAYGTESSITNVMMCAAANGKDSCQGDSGGPLIIKGSDASSDIQVGIVSWGFGCALDEYPGVYASVAKLRGFVTETMENNTAFPDDGFDYVNCSTTFPDSIGNYYCDIANNNTECNYDGGDCKWCPFPEDGFNYGDCEYSACIIGDGICQKEASNYQCNYDGGDCVNDCQFPGGDGFDYSECMVSYPCWVGDGGCDEGYGTPECNYDGGDCGFPADEFDYINCKVDNPSWINDGVCDEGNYNNPECNFDGGDCATNSGFPNDGFDYGNCYVTLPSYINDGYCDGGNYNTPECNFDGGDCGSFPDDGFDYGNCFVTNSSYINDDYCDGGNYNTPECNYDGGDCEQPDDGFPNDGFDYGNCFVILPAYINDGDCDGDNYNTPECNYDGGDCQRPGNSGFPDDGFDYGNCFVTLPSYINDGYCDGGNYNTPFCNFDGGDCGSFPDDGFDYSNCFVTNPSYINDDDCDGGDYNTLECNYDGGDCQSPGNSGFPDDGFDYSDCNVNYPYWIADGDCDSDFNGYETAECNYDGGDCKK